MKVRDRCEGIDKQICPTAQSLGEFLNLCLRRALLRAKDARNTALSDQHIMPVTRHGDADIAQPRIHAAGI